MDRATFSTTAAANVLAISNMTTELNTFATQANALAVAMNLNSTTDTSASSVAIGTGAKTFTVTAGKSFQPGMFLVIADTAAPSTNSMYGQITSYSGATLVMNILSVLGSGTKTAWTISQTSAANLNVDTATTATTATTAIGNLSSIHPLTPVNGTSYQNTSGRPMVLYAQGQQSSAGTLRVWVIIGPNNPASGTYGFLTDGSTLTGTLVGGCCIVPDQYWYSINATGGGTITVSADAFY